MIYIYIFCTVLFLILNLHIRHTWSARPQGESIKDSILCLTAWPVSRISRWISSTRRSLMPRNQSARFHGTQCFGIMISPARNRVFSFPLAPMYEFPVGNSISPQTKCGFPYPSLVALTVLFPLLEKRVTQEFYRWIAKTHECPAINQNQEDAKKSIDQARPCTPYSIPMQFFT